MVRCTLVIGLLSFGVATSSSAQGCSGCAISVTKVATLRAPNDSAGFGLSSRPVADSRGRFLVGPLAEDGRLHAFSSDGRYVRTLGRKGSGPGEFQRISRVFAIPGDSMLVYDPMNARMTVLDPAYRAARAIRLSGVIIDVVRLRDGTLLASGVIERRGRIDDPYHVIGDTGFARSFGRETDTSRDARYYRNMRILAPSRRGGFWSGRSNEYTIEYSDVAAPPRIAVRRTVPWFPTWMTPQAGPPWFVRPNPRISAIREDDQGFLWTLILVPPADWKPATNARPRGREIMIAAPPVNEIDQYVNRVVEVIDPKTGNALASRRLPGTFGGFVGTDMIFQQRETTDGDIALDIFRLALNRTARR